MSNRDICIHRNLVTSVPDEGKDANIHIPRPVSRVLDNKYVELWLSNPSDNPATILMIQCSVIPVGDEISLHVQYIYMPIDDSLTDERKRKTGVPVDIQIIFKKDLTSKFKKGSTLTINKAVFYDLNDPSNYLAHFKCVTSTDGTNTGTEKEEVPDKFRFTRVNQSMTIKGTDNESTQTMYTCIDGFHVIL